MNAIGPGDWVECVRESETAPGYISVGAIYRIEDAWLSGACLKCGKRESISLVGHPIAATAKYDAGWSICLFRPIRSDITQIERLLTQPIPADLADTLARIVCGMQDGIDRESARQDSLDGKQVKIMSDDTEALAKELAIKLAVRELGRIKPQMGVMWYVRDAAKAAIVKNLLIGLGCEAVVKAWEECT